jgi:hypothetical protein
MPVDKKMALLKLALNQEFPGERIGVVYGGHEGLRDMIRPSVMINGKERCGKIMSIQALSIDEYISEARRLLEARS